MTGATRTRRLLVVAGAAACGVLAAVGLLTGATRLVGGGSSGDAASTSGAASPGSGDPGGVPAGRSTSSTSSAGRAPGSASRDGEPDPSAPVTVDVPRSDQAAAPDLRPGAGTGAAAPPSPVAAVPIDDPRAAAKLYVAAAESVTGGDGARHHRAARLMAPDNPAATTGLVVTDPPPDGHSRTVEVVAVEVHARNDDLGRIAYRVTYQRHLSPTIPATSTKPEGPPQVTYVVVEEQPSGGWLVLSQTNHLDPVE